MSISELKDQILNLSLLDASALVKQLEEQLGISAMAMAMPQAASSASTASESAAEEKSEYSLSVEGISNLNKIAAIKVVRAHLGLGLKESKEFVESIESAKFPTPFTEKAYPKAEAEKLKGELAEVGITVKLV